MISANHHDFVSRLSRPGMGLCTADTGRDGAETSPSVFPAYHPRRPSPTIFRPPVSPWDGVVYARHRARRRGDPAVCFLRVSPAPSLPYHIPSACLALGWGCVCQTQGETARRPGRLFSPRITRAVPPLPYSACQPRGTGCFAALSMTSCASPLSFCGRGPKNPDGVSRAEALGSRKERDASEDLSMT